MASAEDETVITPESAQEGAVQGKDDQHDGFGESPSKRVKLSNHETPSRQKGQAPIKAEYLIHQGGKVPEKSERDDDAAEASAHVDPKDSSSKQKKKSKGGQNTSRQFGSWRDKLQLCGSRMFSPEFSPKECKFGGKCKFEHDLRKYLIEGKRENLTTFDGTCPIWRDRGVCNAGWKCRFAKSHSEERDTEDGKKELVLIDNPNHAKVEDAGSEEHEFGTVNVVATQAKIDLQRRRTKTPKSDVYDAWLKKTDKEDRKGSHIQNFHAKADAEPHVEPGTERKQAAEENRAQYKEPPLLPSEKRRIYYGPETPVLAPLTTQGNLPFRRLCVELGAQVTWSEMAMGLPLIQGEKGEWALMKAHESEILPPRFSNRNTVVEGYDNARDLKFGAQIAANKPWLALKTTEVLTSLCHHLRAIDLNCGCPIDLVYRQGAGSALLDAPGRLEKILRGMNAVSNDVPITVKIRMGTKDSSPNALKITRRVAFGVDDANEVGLGPPGVAAITLHGRSRQQRYTRSADWSYIAECAALIKNYKKEDDERADTVKEADPRSLPNGGKVFFVGNGDCYSHVDYNAHMADAGVDSVMVARGALIKPWIFEEIETNQYFDKSASERLTYIEKFVKNGLEAWGSDEMGVGTTRRFLLEWLSFQCRYVPLGLLEVLPPNIQDRPPRFRGRNELETLLSSDNYKDWIKISEMFLGPAHPDFKFEPKHKSNSYEIEAEG